MSFLDKFNLNGKVALVTGGGSGIGKRSCEILAECGADIAVLDINHESASITAGEINERYHARAIAVKADVTDEQDIQNAVRKVVETFHKIDILMNNAGITYLSPIEEIPIEKYQKVMDINLKGTLIVSREVAKEMIKYGNGGSIITTASVCGHIISYPRKSSAYCISKAGVLQMTKAMAVEWAPYGIRVNTISPGYVYTDMIKGSDVIPQWEAHTLFGKLAQTDDLMGAIVFLAGDTSSYMTGADIPIDGGYTCR